MTKPDINCRECDNQLYTVGYAEGYQAGLAKSQADDDDAFWLRQYAGQAMQGILSAETMGYTTSKTNIALNAECAVEYAKALLEEVKKNGLN